jgi:hypothetical protein
VRVSWAAATLIASTTVWADDGAFRWDAPDECPPAEQIQLAIEHMVGRTIVEARAGRPAIRGVITRIGPAHYRLVLETNGAGEPARRVLEAPTCSGLSDAAVAVVGLALDWGAPTETEPRAVSPQPAAPTLTPAAASLRSSGAAASLRSSTRPSPRRTPRPGLRAEPLAHVTADAGTLPGAATGLGLGVGFGSSRVHFVATATVFFDRRVPIGGASGAGGADVWLAEGAMSACRPFPLGERWEARACGGLHVGRIAARSFDVSGARTAEALWMAASAGGSVWWHPTGPIVLFLSVDAVVPLARPRFVTGDGAEVHRPAIASARVSFGPALRFP